jgi:hypothetical protein
MPLSQTIRRRVLILQTQRTLPASSLCECARFCNKALIRIRIPCFVDEGVDEDESLIRKETIVIAFPVAVLQG